MPPSPIPAQCEGCSSKFSWLRKRRTCVVCRSVCCSSCMQWRRLCGVARQCLRCARVAGVRYERAVLQQMTVRDLKHIMKIVDVSSATCREKSDLVDTILMCRGPTEQATAPAGQPTHPLDTAPSAPSAPSAPAPTAAPRRARPGDSGRVGPYESIRVRAVDDSDCLRREEPAYPRPPDCEGNAPSSETPSVDCEEEGEFVVVDVETTEDGRNAGEEVPVETAVDRPVEVEVDGPVEVEVEGPAESDGPAEADGPVGVDSPAEPDRPVAADASVVQVEVEAAPDAAESRAAAAGDGDDDGDGAGDAGEEVEVVVDDDPDEPQSESVVIEADSREDDDADDPSSETDVDLSRLTDVSQIPSEELISRLTVRQCKRLLQRRRTEYRDVIEKEELLRRVHLLWRETRRNAEALASAADQDICKICMDALVDCVMLECGHMATCTACGKQLAECPICRKYVVRVVHVFRS